MGLSVVTDTMTYCMQGATWITHIASERRTQMLQEFSLQRIQ